MSGFGRITTRCQCWKLIRSDGRVLGFTDHDRAIVFGGVSYDPAGAFTASEARATLGLSADSQDIVGALDSEWITRDDIAAGLYDHARVESYGVDWTRPEEAQLLRTAEIAAITIEDGRFTAELAGFSARLDRVSGRLFRRGCDAELGDLRCRFDLSVEGYSLRGTIHAASEEASLEIAVAAGRPDGWFDGGLVHLEAGTGASLPPLRIASHRGERITLAKLPRMALSAGMAVRLSAGCDKSHGTCRAKFDNLQNFRGFPHLPGNDAAYGFATTATSFDGGALVR